MTLLFQSSFNTSKSTQWTEIFNVIVQQFIRNKRKKFHRNSGTFKYEKISREYLVILCLANVQDVLNRDNENINRYAHSTNANF